MVLFVFLYFLEKSRSPCRKKILGKKTKNKKRKIRTDLQLKKGNFWTDFQLYSMRIYIYIYAVELKTGPRFGVSSVKNWSKSSVKNWSNLFLAVFPQFYSVFGHF